jgi:hypothetical protein
MLNKHSRKVLVDQVQILEILLLLGEVPVGKMTIPLVLKQVVLVEVVDQQVQFLLQVEQEQ